MRSLKREIIEEICVALFVVLVTLLLWRRPIVVTVLLVVGSAALFVLWHTRADILAYITAVLIGFIADYICTEANFYTFSVPDMLKLPSWGPICWGYLYVLFMRGASTLHRILREGWLGRHDTVKRIFVSLIQILIVIYLWKTVTVVNKYLAATLGLCWWLARVFGTGNGNFARSWSQDSAARSPRPRLFIWESGPIHLTFLPTR